MLYILYIYNTYTELFTSLTSSSNHRHSIQEQLLEELCRGTRKNYTLSEEGIIESIHTANCILNLRTA